ncbi:MAG TPA: serine/threonine-protein kinase [Polyangiaceae bacterium]|nr:serine/threonine-protein kinase [Polyangiaceae bacterium]
MSQASDDELTSHGEMVFDDEFLDDSAPTRVSIDPRLELRHLLGRECRAEQVRVGDLLVGKYRVERVHRRGALGLTLEAMHTQLGQRVAVRLLSADPKAYPEAAARFLRGARLAVQFQNDHTARIIDVGCLESGAPYIVAELLSGSDFQRVLRVRDSLPVGEAVDFLLQACEGLAEAHAHNIVHRNLKPTNLFLTRRDGVRRVAVLDFGVSEDPLSDIAVNLGTTQGAAKALAYLAPEQIRDPATVDARADIWALGAVLHEMLSGCRLHDAQATPALLAMIAADPAVPLSHLRADVPLELEAVVLRAVAKDREARYSNLAEFAEALRAFASEEGRESVARIAKALGRRARRSLPPPLPAPVPRSKAIVHVAGAARVPAVAQAPNNARRWAELALTGAGLAAAGALGVFFAVHTMEGALVAAIAPHAVVADLSPALPASAVLVSPPPAGAISAAPLALAVPSVAVAAVTAAPDAASSGIAPRPKRPLAPMPARRPVTSAAPAERTVVADAKPGIDAPPRTNGLFDDPN